MYFDCLFLEGRFLWPRFSEHDEVFCCFIFANSNPNHKKKKNSKEKQKQKQKTLESQNCYSSLNKRALFLTLPGTPALTASSKSHHKQSQERMIL